MKAIGLASCSVLLAATSGYPYATVSHAHGGGLAADGCHNDRKNGGRHCHHSNNRPVAVKRSNGSVYYPNCTAARNAGAAPVRRGQPGYGTHLDRDRDGIGCE